MLHQLPLPCLTLEADKAITTSGPKAAELISQLHKKPPVAETANLVLPHHPVQIAVAGLVSRLAEAEVGRLIYIFRRSKLGTDS